ncbi:MAG TPA: hypothetical protein P5268_07525 [Candidatus Marinimicrobia bacterium]|nr:hypothetical protein [Candidatus Neomarinimicrobiota bacterium]HRS52222.1 hypothetical protein [Candidatus Neomarinimicrobiota bacterium]HRU92864.1 hypothetical protein [Candidatus Neomarinimicrobiota bacterium]
MNIDFIKKRVSVGVAIGLVFITRLAAIDNPLVREIQPRNLLNQYNLTLYDLSGNPAFYGISYPDNLDFYLVQATNDNNVFRRLYDPRRQEDYALRFHSAKHLSERNTLVTGIRFNRTIQRDLYQSLEKNIYDEYIAFLDTTTGTTTYNSPQLNFLYDYALTGRLHLGFEINYGVEQSLKDVYTQCEIIARNTELHGGLSYISKNQKTIWGLMGTYYNAHRKYEAVKYYQDAFVRTLFGYHIYKDETPKSTNRKNDERAGGGLALQLGQRDFILPGLALVITGEYKGRSDNVTAGSPQKPTPRGYWIREIRRGILDLNYSPEKSKNSLEFIYEIRSTDDWVKSGNYEVIILDNAELLNALSLHWQTRFSKRLIMNIGADFASQACDYQEYIVPFQYHETNYHSSAFLDLNYAVNQILSVYCLGNLAIDELYFYWNADQATRYGLEIGMERLTTFGRFGAGLEYFQTVFDNPDQYNQTISLKISYWK